MSSLFELDLQWQRYSQIKIKSDRGLNVIRAVSAVEMPECSSYRITGIDFQLSLLSIENLMNGFKKMVNSRKSHTLLT